MDECLGCAGDCCRRYRVPITHADLGRLSAEGLSAEDVVDWMPVGDFHNTYPDVRLDIGYQYMVLRVREDGACVLSKKDGRGRLLCTIHGRHPPLCRLYPLSQDGTPISHRKCGRKVRLRPDLASIVDERTLESGEYSKMVRSWNSRLRRSRKSRDFIEFILSR